MSRLPKLAGWMAVAGLLAASPALAQASGSLTGRVHDETGFGLPGVVCRVLEIGHQSVTDENGAFRFLSLPPGVYTILCEREGFSTHTLENVQVSAGGSTPLEIEMAAPAMAEAIVVMSEPKAGPEFRTDRCQDPLALPEEDGGTAAPDPRYRPICFLGQAGYAFNAPPGLNYLEEEYLHFRLNPTETALEAKEAVEYLGLRGAVEAGTERWSRCMEAELVETTIDSPLRARPTERRRLRIHTMVRDEDDPAAKRWEKAADGDAVLVHKMGLHATEWRWRITGIQPGRTQLTLRLYAVAVLASSSPGNPICAPREEGAGTDGSRRRVRTLQRRLAIEVSASEWVDAKLPPPALWTLLLPPAGAVLAWWRRRRRKPALESGTKS